MKPLTDSIVIAACNEGENVRRTVESVLANTQGADFEMVLIDDGSNDESFAFLESGELPSDVPVRRQRFQESVGCIRARHRGIELARGDRIILLDAHMAVPQGWLSRLSAALERRGPFATIAADIATLDDENWAPGSFTGQIMTINETLDFVWQYSIHPTGLMSTAPGCCVMISRRFYFQIGGFDLGLRRWGCEFVDLILKVYAAGGVCYREPSVLVGHLFREAFPYAMDYDDLTYNKLRTGYIHFPDGSFRLLLDRLVGQPGFDEAIRRFRVSLSELDHLRRAQRAANRRDPNWFVRTFLPALCQGSSAGA